MNKITISIIGIFLLNILFCCSKTPSEQQSYGVSISAPKIWAIDSTYTKEQIEWIKLNNGLSIDILLQNISTDSTIDNLQYSCLSIISQLNKEEEELQNLMQKILQQDTNLKILTQLDTTSKDKLKINTQISLPLLYEEALKTNQKQFYDLEDNPVEKEFFTLIGIFKTNISEEQTIVEIPLGNKEYSIVLIQPNTNKITNYLSLFREKTYIDCLEKLQERKIEVSFPNIESTKYEGELNLPQTIKDTLQEELKTINILSEFNSTKPTEATLKLINKTMEDKIISSNYEQGIIFNKPFLYILKQRTTNLILQQGIIVK